MKTLNDFSAFKLNKNQMGAMKGGKVTCMVIYTDGFGGSFSLDFNQPGVTPEAAKEYLASEHKEASRVECYESGI